MARLDEWYRKRRAVPLRSETSAKLVRTLIDGPDEAVAEVQLYSRLFYEKSGITHREDRIERERLTFCVKMDNGALPVWSVRFLNADLRGRAAVPAGRFCTGGEPSAIEP